MRVAIMDLLVSDTGVPGGYFDPVTKRRGNRTKSDSNPYLGQDKRHVGVFKNAVYTDFLPR